MKTYEASQELVNILLSNGFVEDTITTYPEHAKRFNGNNYNPHGMKRHFSFPGTREKIYFDYINMKLPTGIQTYRLNSDEVKSLIAFCNLSSLDRSTLVNQHYNSISIPEIISNVDRLPTIYTKAAFKRVKSIFEKLKNIV